MRNSIQGKYYFYGTIILSLALTVFAIVPRVSDVFRIHSELIYHEHQTSIKPRTESGLKERSSIAKPWTRRFQSGPDAQQYLLSQLPIDSIHVKVHRVGSPSSATINGLEASSFDMVLSGSFDELVRLTHFVEFEMDLLLSKLIVSKNQKEDQLEIYYTINSFVDHGI